MGKRSFEFPVLSRITPLLCHIPLAQTTIKAQGDARWQWLRSIRSVLPMTARWLQAGSSAANRGAVKL
jgi:hypothetical protein